MGKNRAVASETHLIIRIEAEWRDRSTGTNQARNSIKDGTTPDTIFPVLSVQNEHKSIDVLSNVIKQD